jgi:hypothetical protein
MDAPNGRRRCRWDALNSHSAGIGHPLLGTFRTSRDVRLESVMRPIADFPELPNNPVGLGSIECRRESSREAGLIVYASGKKAASGRGAEAAGTSCVAPVVRDDAVINSIRAPKFRWKYRQSCHVAEQPLWCGIRHIAADQCEQANNAVSFVGAFAERHGGVLFRCLPEARPPSTGPRFLIERRCRHNRR